MPRAMRGNGGERFFTKPKTFFSSSSRPYDDRAEPSSQLASASTSKSLTAATASIQMDLAFVGGEGEQTKDLNRVLLAPLPDATIGRISSGRKRESESNFSRMSGGRQLWWKEPRRHLSLWRGGRKPALG